MFFNLILTTSKEDYVYAFLYHSVYVTLKFNTKETFHNLKYNRFVYLKHSKELVIQKCCIYKARKFIWNLGHVLNVSSQ